MDDPINTGVVRISFNGIPRELLINGAYILTAEEGSLVHAIGEAFLNELKEQPEFHVFDLSRYSEADLILARAQLEELQDETCGHAPLPSYFNVFRMSVQDELLRRSEPGLQ